MSSTNWTDAIAAVATEFEAENNSHEGRKKFIADGGPARAKAIVAELDALRTRFTPFVFSV